MKRMKGILAARGTFWLSIAAAASIVCCLAFPAASQERMMTINGYAPLQPKEIFGNAWRIFLDGVIDVDAPARLEQYMQQHRVANQSLVYLNSPGGNAWGGQELGRLFRKYELSTNIGKRRISAASRLGYEVDAGECYSACAYAYLGGRFRYLTKGSSYGVHQFTRGQYGNERAAQIGSAARVEYLKSMGIDTELLSLAASAAPTEINILDTQTLERLNVVNYGRTRPVWTIESTELGVYVKGERVTAMSGINKFMLFCTSGQATLYVIFDALSREDELLKMPAHSLLVDGQVYRIQPIDKSITNGWFNGTYNLSLPQVNALRKAAEVGVALQFNYDAPVFLGFDDMPIDTKGKQNLLGILNQC